MSLTQCTETDKQLLQELKTTLAQVDPAYAEEQLAYDQAAAQLSDHTFAEALETQFAAKLLYVTWQGFCWNLDCYRNPVNKLRLHTDYEELHGESHFPSLPKVRAAEEAIRTAQELASKEGIMCGISSGTNVAAAIQLAKKLGEGKTVVTVLPDTAERYFSTPLFEE